MTHDTITDLYRRQMNAVAQALDDTFNGPAGPEGPASSKTVAFVLLIAEFGKTSDGRVNYISNGQREDIVVMLKEILARFEGQPEQSGRA